MKKYKSYAIDSGLFSTNFIFQHGKSDVSREVQPPTANNTIKQEAKGQKKYNGWVAQHIKPTSVQLPVLTVNLIKQQVKEEKRICSDFTKSRILNFDDMSVIRHRVRKFKHCIVNACGFC